MLRWRSASGLSSPRSGTSAKRKGDAEYAVSGNGDSVIGAKKYKLNLYFNPFKRADDQISIEQAAGEQSRLMDEIIASKKPVVDMDDIVKQ